MKKKKSNLSNEISYTNNSTDKTILHYFAETQFNTLISKLSI